MGGGKLKEKKKNRLMEGRKGCWQLCKKQALWVINMSVIRNKLERKVVV